MFHKETDRTKEIKFEAKLGFQLETPMGTYIHLLVYTPNGRMSWIIRENIDISFKEIMGDFVEAGLSVSKLVELSDKEDEERIARDKKIEADITQLSKTVAETKERIDEGGLPIPSNNEAGGSYWPDKK